MSPNPLQRLGFISRTADGATRALLAGGLGFVAFELWGLAEGRGRGGGEGEVDGEGKRGKGKRGKGTNSFLLAAFASRAAFCVAALGFGGFL